MRGMVVLGTLFALLLSGVTRIAANAGQPERFILPLSEGKHLLSQCSRATPQNVTGFWPPSMDDIDRLESALRAALAVDSIVSRAARSVEAPDMFRNHHRQYIGIRIGTEEYIYGSFYFVEDGDLSMSLTEAKEAVKVCDGGPFFFGLVYRKATHSIEQIAFNGAP
jgi:hypothetical protein